MKIIKVMKIYPEDDIREIFVVKKMKMERMFFIRMENLLLDILKYTGMKKEFK